MTLRQRQSKFASMVALLIQFAHEQGYQITFGDTWAFNFWPIIDLITPILPEKWRRAIRARMHSRKSFHYKRLAIDLNLFRDGRYLWSTKAHEPLGIFWESIDEEATWGGRWGDGNHYSFGEK